MIFLDAGLINATLPTSSAAELRVAVHASAMKQAPKVPMLDLQFG